jgi:putative ABC transport system permease protein
MVKGALFRQRSKMFMIGFTVALGSSLASAMLAVMFDIGGKINQELKTYGANITVLPRGASLLNDLYGIGGEEGHYLREDELGNIKTIFWAFNIVDFSPWLSAKASLVQPSDGRNIDLYGVWFDQTAELPTGETFSTGIRNMKSWWQVQGDWPGTEDGALAGIGAAERNGLAPGGRITVELNGRKKTFTVSGILSSGSEEDNRIFVPLAAVQELAGLDGLVNGVEVSALTTPDNELSRRAAQDPKGLSIKEWETWYCTAYVSAICYQIDEVITGAVSKPVRQVAESEGAILEKTELLMLLITVVSMAASALAVSNLVTAGVMERSAEIGLLKALGGNDRRIIALVLAGLAAAGIAGGGAGFFAGLGFARIIGHTVFGSGIAFTAVTIPIVAALVLLVILAGSIPAIRFLLSLRPAEVLHGR